MFWMIVTVMLSGQPTLQYPVESFNDRVSCETAIELAFPHLVDGRGKVTQITCVQSKTEPATLAPTFEGHVGGQDISD